MKFKSVLLVGFIFGLFHMQPLGLFTLSILGMLFGYFYYKSKSLLPAMAAHFTNNFLAVLILYNPEPIQQFNLAAIEQIPLKWILITLPIGIGLVYLYKIVSERRVSQSEF
jgi:membrane protease YdiL (CAAX protease family)